MAGSTAAQDWTQWMQWDGEEQPSAPHLSNLTTPTDNAHTPDSGNTNRPYPVSPSSTLNSDVQPFLSIPKSSSHANLQINGPLTPSHGSSSPETLHPPGHRLSGDTLRSTSSSEFSRLHLKRKSSDGEELTTPIDTIASQQKPASKKRPHNVIEKRYRANLNEKIAELRQSVPSLRSSGKGPKETEDLEDENDDQAGSTKLNKASILTKAVEYIRHLELRNRKLDNENVCLKQRLLKLERVLASDGNNGKERAAAFTTENTVEEVGPEKDAVQAERALKHPPQGLIPVPESIKKLRQNLPQEHYGSVYDTPHEGQTSGRKWPARLMIGSLAGLMIMDGLSESQDGSDSKARGLFGIPLEFMDGWWFLRSPKAFIAAFMQYCRAGGVVPLAKGFLALSILAFIVFAYLFNSKPAKVEPEEKPSNPRRLPSLASPIEVRRQAWLTSMQSLKLPTHIFFPEWFAVTMEWLNYTLCLALGFPIYSRITGKSEEEELARTKAWDIAIDAQLAGGDPEISRSRLVLSIFASGTLPQSPARLMLTALHCRIVLWKVGREDGVVSRTCNKIAVFFANRQWRKARRLAEGTGAKDANALPAHLAEILRYECQDVMLDPVLQRAYNLMYDRPTDEASYGSNSLMDVVVEDHAISSPLDAVAAWWSSQKLHQALVLSLSERKEDQTLFKTTLDLCLKIAPPLSAAYTRALAVKAVFFDQGRAQNAHKVLSALPTSKSKHSPENQLLVHAPVFIDSSMPLSACPEVSTVLDCATIMIELHGSRTIEGFGSMKRMAAELFASLELEPFDMSLLSFAPAFSLLWRLLQDGSSSPCRFSRTIRDLAIWAHAETSESACLSPGVVTRLDLLCNEVDKDHKNRRQSSVSNDTGYGSLGETDIS